jgi:nucleoside-diphosphate-sugar epimerase
MILVTGAEGLIGRHLCARLEAEGLEVRRFDLRRSPGEDIRDSRSLAAALKDVAGVIHLAAVSRVVWAERSPALCQATNVDALNTLVSLCLEQAQPWIIFASSREVYGHPDRLPVGEDHPLRPVNTYARSKRDGEQIAHVASDAGLLANICRFSNVYGCPLDHADRVVMAFAAAAARGGVMSVEGADSLFDFTAVADAVDGLWRLVQASLAGEALPPVHFVSGQGTSLGELAEIAAARALGQVTIKAAPARDFDVSSFVGDPARAKTLLGWTARADLGTEIARLITALAAPIARDRLSEPTALP